MKLNGIYKDAIKQDADLVASLDANHIENFKAVPKTVMINPFNDTDRWIVIDSTYPAQIDRRLDIISGKPDWVIARMEGDDVKAAECELRDYVVAYLTTTYPGYFTRKGDMVLSRLTGIAVDVGPYGADPLVAVGALATEDMLMMVPSGQDAKGNTLYPLKTGILAFPNGWSLTSKFNKPEPSASDIEAHEEWTTAQKDSLFSARLGKTTHEIHNGAVRHFMENYATRVDMFFSRMPPGEKYWRRNWGPSITTELFRHSDTHIEYPAEFNVALWDKQGYVRSEHETFVKLPQSKAVVFGIKTFIWPLKDVIANPVAFGALTEAFNTMEKTPSMFEYRAASLPTFGAYLRNAQNNAAPSPGGPAR
jgi:hypothetical protein